MRGFVGAMLVATILVAAAEPAAAHTGLDASNPPDGATATGPLAEVVLHFTGTPIALDDSVAAADAEGVIHRPVEVVQNGLQITARFDPPLPSGDYAVAWQVRSDDTHVVSGEFRFTVAAPPTTSSSTTSTAVPPITGADGSSALPATTLPPAAAPPTTASVAPAAGSELDDVAPPQLAAAATTEGEWATRVGRFLFFPATAVAIGALVFIALAFTGRPSEVVLLLFLARAAGAVVAVGASIEFMGLVELLGGLGNALEASGARAAFARVVAGVFIAWGLTSIPRPPARSLSAAVTTEPVGARAFARWRPQRSDAIGVLGATMLVGTFAFDGHTVSEGPRLVHAVAAVVHVTAGSVWVGGVVALALTLWGRRRRGSEGHAAEMAARFSVIATLALAAASTTGLAISWFIDDDIGGYGSTQWSRILLVKGALVVGAAGLGGYNHFRLIPAIEARPNDRDVIARIRTSVTLESVLLLGIGIISALLVGGDTSV